MGFRLAWMMMLTWCLCSSCSDHPATSKTTDDSSAFREGAKSETSETLNGSTPGFSGKWYRDDRFEFEICIPESWRVTRKNERLVKLDIVSGDGKSGFQIRVQEPYHGTMDAFLDGYVTGFKRDMEGHWGGELVELGRENLILAEGRGIALSFSLRRRDGQTWFFKQYIYPIRNHRIIFVQAGCRQFQRNSVEPLLDEMARSFRFTGR